MATKKKAARKKPAKVKKGIKHDRFAKPKKTKKKPATKTPARKAVAKKNMAAAEGRAKEREDRRDVIKIKKLEPLAKKIQVRFERAAVAEGKADDHRLAAAVHLAEAAALCKKEKINFEDWATSNFTQGYNEIRRLTGIGKSDNPAQAIADLRENTRQRMQKARTRKQLAPPAGDIPTLYSTADDALEALMDETRFALIDDHATKMGMVVMSKTDADGLKQAEERVGQQDLVGLTDFEIIFGKLSASDKMSFLDWATESIGAKVDYSFSAGDADVEEEEETPALATEEDDLADIPKYLKRQPAAAE